MTFLMPRVSKLTVTLALAAGVVFVLGWLAFLSGLTTVSGPNDLEAEALAPLYLLVEVPTIALSSLLAVAALTSARRSVRHTLIEPVIFFTAVAGAQIILGEVLVQVIV